MAPVLTLPPPDAATDAKAEAFFERLMRGPLVSSAPVDLATPRRVGPWEVGAPLGRGGGCRVYRATGDTPDGPVEAALKLSRQATPQARIGFLREADLLARFDRPTVPQVLDAGVHDDGRPYLALEPITGERITCAARRRSARGRLQLVARACRAADRLHVEGVVHGDLKPEHLLVREDGAVTILDLGASVDLRVPERSAARPRHSLTPEFAAPEQILGERVSPSTDVYALGLVLHEVLYGRSRRMPWGLGGDPSIATRPLRTPRRLRPDGAVSEQEEALDWSVAPVLRMALHTRPLQRYASAGALARALDAVLNETAHAWGL